MSIYTNPKYQKGFKVTLEMYSAFTKAITKLQLGGEISCISGLHDRRYCKPFIGRGFTKLSPQLPRQEKESTITRIENNELRIKALELYLANQIKPKLSLCNSDYSRTS